MHKLLLPFLLFIGFYANAQTVTSLYKLTAGKATADKGKPGEYHVPVTLTNTGKDTLYYLSWSCSWQEMYRSSNPNIKVQESVCKKNAPIRLVLPPGKSNTVTLLFFTEGKTAAPATFKVGFNLIILPGDNSWRDIWSSKMNEQNPIWSNEISTGEK